MQNNIAKTILVKKLMNTLTKRVMCSFKYRDIWKFVVPVDIKITNMALHPEYIEPKNISATVQN